MTTHAYRQSDPKADPLCGVTDAQRALEWVTGSVVLPRGVDCRDCRWIAGGGTGPAPAKAPPQCYRTFPHSNHETTEGRCPGLEGTPAALVSMRQLLVSQVEEALDQAQAYGESKGQADTLAALRRAATHPVTAPLSRTGVLLSTTLGEQEDTDDAPLAREGLRIPGPDRPATDPWTEKPSYLMLELALRKVRDDLRAWVSGDDFNADWVEAYIDRVLANDLTDPEDTTAPEPDRPALCEDRPHHPGMRIPTGCDLPPDHQGDHHTWWDAGRGGITVTWARD